MLMARYGVSADGAFDLLSQKSHEQNVKVRVIAEVMVVAAARGELVAALVDPREPTIGAIL